MKHILVFETKEILILKDLLETDIKSLEAMQVDVADIYTGMLAKMISEKEKMVLTKLNEAVLLEKT